MTGIPAASSNFYSTPSPSRNHHNLLKIGDRCTLYSTVDRGLSRLPLRLMPSSTVATQLDTRCRLRAAQPPESIAVVIFSSTQESDHPTRMVIPSEHREPRDPSYFRSAKCHTSLGKIWPIWLKTKDRYPREVSQDFEPSTVSRMARKSFLLIFQTPASSIKPPESLQ